MSSAQADAISQPWASLHEALAGQGKPLISRNTLAAWLVNELTSALQHFAEHGFAPFSAEWQRRDVLANQPVRIEGEQPLQGTANGIDADGGLIVMTDTGRCVVHAGDVSVRRQ